MSSLPPEVVVIVEPPPVVEVIVEPPPEIVVETSEVGMVGPKGDGAADVAAVVADVADLTDEVTTHISSPRPHQQAESGKDFAAWFSAGIV